MSAPDTHPASMFEVAFLGKRVLVQVTVDPETLEADARFNFESTQKHISNKTWFTYDIVRMFLSQAEAPDPERFGTIDAAYRTHINASPKQRQACVTQVLIDVLTCVDKIFQKHPRMLPYAQWYLDERRREAVWISVHGPTYSQFVTTKACAFIVREFAHYWPLVEF